MPRRLPGAPHLRAVSRSERARHHPRRIGHKETLPCSCCPKAGAQQTNIARHTFNHPGGVLGRVRWSRSAISLTAAWMRVRCRVNPFSNILPSPPAEDVSVGEFCIYPAIERACHNGFREGGGGRFFMRECFRILRIATCVAAGFLSGCKARSAVITGNAGFCRNGNAGSAETGKGHHRELRMR